MSLLIHSNKVKLNTIAANSQCVAVLPLPKNSIHTLKSVHI